GYSDNLDHTRFAVQAYAGLVLARSQQAPLGSLRALCERRGDARSGLPLVQLAVALQKMDDKPRADEALALGLGLGRQRREWLADYGSPLRDQALILALLEENDLAASSRDQLLFQLAEERALQRYLSTQERNALFLAGRGLVKQPERDWSASLQAGDQQRGLSNADPALKLEGASLVEPLSLSSDFTGKLYQQLTISGYPTQAPQPRGNNLSIERGYYGLEIGR